MCSKKYLKGLKVVNMVSVLPSSVCMILIGYFYRIIYLSVSKGDTCPISRVHFLVKARLTTKVAKMTGILTAVVLNVISFAPSLVIVIFRGSYPALRRSSYFRLSKMLAEINSLFKPVRYCDNDRRYRSSVLEMFKMRKPAVGVRGRGRRIVSVLLLGSPNCSSIKLNLSTTDHQTTKVKPERRATVPSCETSRVS